MRRPTREPSGPPSLRTATVKGLLIAVPVAAFAALAYGRADALVALVIFGGGNIAVYYTLQVWNNRSRR